MKVQVDTTKNNGNYPNHRKKQRRHRPRKTTSVDIGAGRLGFPFLLQGLSFCDHGSKHTSGAGSPDHRIGRVVLVFVFTADAGKTFLARDNETTPTLGTRDRRGVGHACARLASLRVSAVGVVPWGARRRRARGAGARLAGAVLHGRFGGEIGARGVRRMQKERHH